MSYRIGKGYDVHQLQENLPLILGGIHIKHHKGILAHSDGDILVHAIIDSILGALAVGDLGKFFPNTEKWKNISGLIMLQHIKKLLSFQDNKFLIINIDATIILQTPKLSNYIEKMKKNIAESLEINIEQISIKATTTDKLGFIGSEKGIAAESICLLKYDN